MGEQLTHRFWAKNHEGTRYAGGSVIPSAELSSDTYHQVAPGVSKSGLDKARRNVLSLLEPSEESTAAMDIGSATNDALLHPDTFHRLYMRGPEDRRGNRWKDAEAAAAEAGVTLLVERDYDLCIVMRDALLMHPEVKKLMAGGFDAEPSFFWEDPETGLLCRARPDWDLHNGILVDLKTAADASPGGFRNAVFQRRYQVQNAFYCAGRAAVRGDVRGMVFVVVDKKNPRPENVALYQVDDRLYEEGWKQAREDMDRLAAWLRTEDEQPGQWRGFPLDVQLITFSRNPIAGDDALAVL